MKIIIASIAIVLSLTGCSTGEDSSSAAVTLSGSWAGGCSAVGTQGSSRPVIGFSGGRIAVKVFQYISNITCSGPKSGASRLPSTATYTELGLSGSGLSTKINVSTLIVQDGREVTRYRSVLPRSFDLYYIENGTLYYGDYAGFDGSSESKRPIIYKNAPIATYLGLDVSEVF